MWYRFLPPAVGPCISLPYLWKCRVSRENYNWFCLEWGSHWMLDGKFSSALLLRNTWTGQYPKEVRMRRWGTVPHRSHTGRGSLHNEELQECRRRNRDVPPQLLSWWWAWWWHFYHIHTELYHGLMPSPPMAVIFVPIQFPRVNERWRQNGQIGGHPWCA